MLGPVPAHSPCQSTSGSRQSRNSQAFHFSVTPRPPEECGLGLPPLLLCKAAPLLDGSLTHVCKLISDPKPRPRPYPFPSFPLVGFLDHSLLLLLTPSPSLSIPPSGFWLVKRGGAWLRATSMHTNICTARHHQGRDAALLAFLLSLVRCLHSRQCSFTILRKLESECHKHFVSVQQKLDIA